MCRARKGRDLPGLLSPLQESDDNKRSQYDRKENCYDIQVQQVPGAYGSTDIPYVSLLGILIKNAQDLNIDLLCGDSLPFLGSFFTELNDRTRYGERSGFKGIKDIPLGEFPATKETVL
jgi:hypothetical protein